MPRGTATIQDDYFDALYADGADPWRFATSDYEREKYATTLAAIGPTRIARAWEVGCAIGVFTRQLATRCDSLLAIDVSENALAQARRRCAELANVQLRQMRIPQAWPDGHFDLMVFSEVLYYLVPDDIRAVARGAVASLAPGGRVVLVHWTGETDYPCTGDQAAELFCETCANRLAPVQHDRHHAYRLDVLRAVGDSD